MHAVHTPCVSTFNFQLLAEVNGPANAVDSTIIMANPRVAFGSTNRFGSGVVFHKIPRVKETQKLWLIAHTLAKPLYLKHACVCFEPFLEGDTTQIAKCNQK